MPLVAVVDRARTLHVSDLSGEGMRPLTHLDDAAWPAWVPGTRSVVYSTHIDALPAVVLRDVTRPGQPSLVLFRNDAGAPAALGPGTPHYVVPSPDGRLVAIVAPTARGMGLFVRDLATGADFGEYEGAPIFPAWNAAGGLLAVHATNDLFVVDCRSRDVRPVTSGDAAGFRTPALGPHGELAYVARSGAGFSVGWGQVDGSGWAPGPVTDGGAVGMFRPGTAELWLAGRPLGTSGLLSQLGMARQSAATAEPVYRGPFHAFSWSPSGRSLVLAVPRQPGDDRTALVAISETGVPYAESETFLPSDSQRALWSFFDQFHHSHPSWLTVDGEERFIVSGRPGTDRVSPTLGASAGNRVLLWRPRRGEPLMDLCAGEIAVPQAGEGTA